VKHLNPHTKIIFLDRDGVINQFPGMGSYVTQWKDLHFIPKATRAIKLLSEAGYEINVISNQGCVARKQITFQDLDRLTARMLKMVEKDGGKIDGVFYCVHQASDHCGCKKPKVALFRKALRRRKVNLRRIYFVGDSQEDMQAAKNLGCRGLLVLSGRTKAGEFKRFDVKPSVVKKDLWSAAQWIIRKKH